MSLITLLQAQLAQRQAYVTYYDARIRTGVYKSRIVHHGGMNGPLLTEEELLQDEMATMLQHIRLMQDIIDEMNKVYAEEKPRTQSTDEFVRSRMVGHYGRG